VSDESRWLTPNVWGFSLASLFSDMGHELVTTVLPGFLLGLGAPPIALGVIEGISNLAQAWASVWGGRRADQSRRRWAVLVWGYVLTGLKTLIGLVSAWPWILLLRTLAWVGRGARGPIRNTLIAEEVLPSQLGKAYGFRELFDTLGAVVGPLTATILAARVSPRMLILWSGVPAVFTVAAILLFVRDPRRSSSLTDVCAHHRVSEMPMPRTLSKFLWASGVFASGYVAPTFFIWRVWRARYGLFGLNPHVLALALYTLHNIVYAAGSYPAGAWTDRHSAKDTVILGSAIWTLVLVGFALPKVPGFLWVGLFMGSGLATALIETGKKTWATHLLDPAHRGTGLGLLAGVTGLGQLTAGILVGGLWTLGFRSTAFFLVAGLTGMATIWLSRVPRRVT